MDVAMSNSKSLIPYIEEAQKGFDTNLITYQVIQNMVDWIESSLRLQGLPKDSWFGLKFRVDVGAKDNRIFPNEKNTSTVFYIERMRTDWYITGIERVGVGFRVFELMSDLSDYQESCILQTFKRSWR